MGNDIAIKTEKLSKSYKLYNKPRDRFKETFHPFRKKYHHDFYALNDISFEIKKGDTVGIIGKNGAGKSTLLKIIYNVIAPTSGNVVVNGNVSALLEIGSGFNPLLTGIENIYFNGTLMGFSKEAMDKKIDDILSFADIGEFVYQPVKTYSTGMFMRLSFSVATCIDPEILIIDEALSVGDIYFKAKCVNKMRKMIDEKDVTLLFVSHDLMSIKSICKKALFLKEGKMIYYGECEKAVEKYFTMKVKDEQQVTSQELNEPDNTLDINEKEIKDKKFLMFEDNATFQEKAKYERVQNGKASFVNVQLLDENENVINLVEYEQNLTLRMSIEIHEDLHLLDYAYQIRNVNGVEGVYSNSIIENCSLHNLKEGDRYVIDWFFKASLTNFHGNYSIVSILGILIDYEQLEAEYCDFVPISVQFQMLPRKRSPVAGIVHWDNKVDIVKL